MVSQFEISAINNLLLHIFNWAPYQSGYFLKSRRIKIKRAPEPLDIIWENLELGLNDVIPLRLKCCALLILALLSSFWIFLGLGYLSINEDFYLGLLISILIQLVNIIIYFILVKTV